MVEAQREAHIECVSEIIDGFDVSFCNDVRFAREKFAKGPHPHSLVHSLINMPCCDIVVSTENKSESFDTAKVC